MELPRVLSVWVDGRLRDESATVPLLDQGYTHGLGAFESLLVRRGRPYALERHLRRLTSSMSILGLPPVGDETVREAVEEAVAGAGSPQSARIRIHVTGGDVATPTARLSVVLTEFVPGVAAGELRVVSSAWVRNERSAVAGAKTSSYAENVVALADARRRGAQEALLANACGDLCEGAACNVFVETLDGRLVTPPLTSGCLPGVMREIILEWCIKGRTEIVEDSVPFGDLKKISTIMLSNAVRGLRLVTHLDGRRLAPSKQGQRLVEAVSERLEKSDQN